MASPGAECWRPAQRACGSRFSRGFGPRNPRKHTRRGKDSGRREPTHADRAYRFNFTASGVGWAKAWRATRRASRAHASPRWTAWARRGAAQPRSRLCPPLTASDVESSSRRLSAPARIVPSPLSEPSDPARRRGSTRRCCTDHRRQARPTAGRRAQLIEREGVDAAVGGDEKPIVCGNQGLEMSQVRHRVLTAAEQRLAGIASKAM